MTREATRRARRGQLKATIVNGIEGGGHDASAAVGDIASFINNELPPSQKITIIYAQHLNHF